MKDAMSGNKARKNCKKALKKRYRKDQKWGGWRKWMDRKRGGWA